MNNFFNLISKIDCEIEAKEFLVSILPSNFNKQKILKTVDFAITAHKDQYRKSGEAYVTHPILVSTIVIKVGGDEDMVISALLHDVVEDTKYNIDYIKDNYGNSISHLVDGLTKITEIKEEFRLGSKSNDDKLISSALSFRKMLIASIHDIRLLVIKLCDRVHNMMTLDALSDEKQLRIAKDSLLVFAPIAHRLGISVLKNIIEDKSFYYIFPKEYNTIDLYIKENLQQLNLKLNDFISKLTKQMIQAGFLEDDFEIKSRVKHYYSIYLKMGRKGVNIDEVLDLLALRIILKDNAQCYTALGVVHQNFRPLMARFKDYIAIPKENGYQTIHTTVFDKSNIFEIQIRTNTMHDNAEFGLAAHWKYKSSNSSNLDSNIKWLKSLEYQNSDVTEFYELAKGDLYSDDIVIISPKGTRYTLPKNSTSLDFAYAVHSDIGRYAHDVYINGEKKTLLTILRDGDNVNIITKDKLTLRCSWINSVFTAKARQQIKHDCKLKIKEINIRSNTNILSNLFEQSYDIISEYINSGNTINKLSDNLNTFSDLKLLKDSFKEKLLKTGGFMTKVKLSFKKLKVKQLDNFNIYSNSTINGVRFDYCCHPKYDDEIIAFKDGKKAIIHHKLCDKASNMINSNQVLFVEWVKGKRAGYSMIISLENTKGSLAAYLEFLSSYDINVISLKIGDELNSHINYCEMKIDTDISDINKIKSIVSKKVKILELYEVKDAYK